MTHLTTVSDDTAAASSAENYVEIPPEIGFLKKMQQRGRGQNLPMERIALPIAAKASARMLIMAFFYGALGFGAVFLAYQLFLGPQNIFTPDRHGHFTSVIGLIWLCFLGLLILLAGISLLIFAFRNLSDFNEPEPLLVVDKDSFQDTRLSARVIAWTDVAFYECLSAKGTTVGLAFYLLKPLAGDRRLLRRWAQRKARQEKLGNDRIVVMMVGLSVSSYVATNAMRQLATLHGVRPRPTPFDALAAK